MAQAGRKVALLDADLNAPSLLTMLGLKTPRRILATELIEPMSGPQGLRIVSSGMLTDGEPPPMSFADEEILPAFSANGHGPVELNYADTLSRLVSRTRLTGVELLLVDLAPGLGQLHRLARLVTLSGTILVTHSSGLGAKACAAALEMAADSGIRMTGLVENMTGFNCDGCHSVRPLMPEGDLKAAARAVGVPILARLPFDPRLAECCDRGSLFIREYADTPLAKQLKALSQRSNKFWLTRPPNARSPKSPDRIFAPNPNCHFNFARAPDKSQESFCAADVSNAGRRLTNSLRESVCAKPAARAAAKGFKSICEAKPTRSASGQAAVSSCAVVSGLKFASDRSAKASFIGPATGNRANAFVSRGEGDCHTGGFRRRLDA